MTLARMWITYDHFEEKSRFIQVCGVPDTAPPSVMKQFPFRVYDADQNLYYSGFSDTPFHELTEGEALAPQGWAEGDGATGMTILVNGEWEHL